MAKHDYNFKVLDQLYNYEVENDIPAEERLTEWHSDIDIAVPKYIEGKGYVSMKEIYKRYKKIREKKQC